MLGLAYDLAVAWHKAGDEKCRGVLADAEAMAAALPASAEATVRVQGLGCRRPCRTRPRRSPGRGRDGQAARGAAADALALRAGGSGGGPGGGGLAEAEAMKAPAGIFTAAAGGLAQAGKAEAAMAVVEALPPAAIVADAKAAGDVAAVVQQIHHQRQEAAARQAARCKAIAAEYAAAAKKAEAAKDVKTAAAAHQAGRRFPGPGRPTPEVTEERRGPQRPRRGPLGVATEMVFAACPAGDISFTADKAKLAKATTIPAVQISSPLALWERGRG